MLTAGFRRGRGGVEAGDVYEGLKGGGWEVGPGGEGFQHAMKGREGRDCEV